MPRSRLLIPFFFSDDARLVVSRQLRLPQWECKISRMCTRTGCAFFFSMFILLCRHDPQLCSLFVSLPFSLGLFLLLPLLFLVFICFSRFFSYGTVFHPIIYLFISPPSIVDPHASVLHLSPVQRWRDKLVV